MSGQARSRRWIWVLAVPPALFIAWFYLYPVGSLLLETLGAGSLPAIGRSSSVIWFTFAQAAASTVATVLVALPLTAVLSNFDFPGRSLVRAAVTVPFVLPTVVVGAAFLALGVAQSPVAIVAAHVFFNVAVVVRTVGATWARLGPSAFEAARVLGARRFRAFREITLPALLPSLAAAASIVFLFSFTSFGVVLILGGLRYRTIEVEIYRRAITFLDFPAAAALAIAQLVGVAGIMAWYGYVQRRNQAGLQLVPETVRLRKPGRWAPLATAIVMSTLALLWAPLISLVRASFAGNGAGWRFLATQTSAAVSPAAAIGNSLRYAGITLVVAVILGGMAAWVVAGSARGTARLLDLALMLPLGTSAVTVGLGFLVALDEPIDLRGSWVLVPLAHSLIAIPFVVRATVPALRSIRLELKEAAAVLGASPRRVWREIELPLVARSLAVGAGFAAAVSLGEFGATSFVARPVSATVPTLLFRLLARPGTASYAGAMALATVLMALTAGLILVADRGRGGDVGAF